MNRGGGLRMRRSVLRHRAALWVSILAAIAIALFAAPSFACFYSPVNFGATKKHQSTAYDLIYSKYLDEQKRTPVFYNSELAKLRPQFSSKQNDPEFLDQFALYLARAGHDQEAHKIWDELLRREPQRFTTLCNYATTLQLLGRYEQCEPLLTQAAKLKPDLRSGAEGWHLAYLKFLQNQRKDPTYGAKHLFIDELTPIWNTRGDPPKSFRNSKFPKITSDGIAELLRQFPNFGDGWLVLAMTLENEHEYNLARLAYQDARKHGASQGDALSEHLLKMDAYVETQSHVRVAGRAMIQLVILVIAYLVLSRMWKFTKAVRQDRIDARKAREAAEKRAQKK